MTVDLTAVWMLVVMRVANELVLDFEIGIEYVLSPVRQASWDSFDLLLSVLSN
jgi:hypothetical protein